MTSIGLVTRKIAALEISSNNSTTDSDSRLTQTTKLPSQTNVKKLLTKFAAPHPYPKPIQPSSLRNPTPSQSAPPSRPPSPGKGSTEPGIDIGRYDGGFEIDDEVRGEKVYGEAAEDLALDSSVARYVL